MTPKRLAELKMWTNSLPGVGPGIKVVTELLAEIDSRGLEVDRLRVEVARLEGYEYDSMREKGVWTHSTPEDKAAWNARYAELERKQKPIGFCDVIGTVVSDADACGNCESCVR